IALHVDTRATAEMLLQGEFDEVVIATGIVPRTPPIDGVGHPKALGYLDVLRDDKAVGNSVAIVGAGGIGFDVAEYLVHRDRGEHGDADRFFSEWGVDRSYANAGGLGAAR
ncbi:NAD(P)/FAD-dependent oxidoreductase, partial [Burkholderia cepacia]